MTNEWHIRILVGFILGIPSEENLETRRKNSLRVTGAVMETADVRVEEVTLHDHKFKAELDEWSLSAHYSLLLLSVNWHHLRCHGDSSNENTVAVGFSEWEDPSG